MTLYGVIMLFLLRFLDGGVLYLNDLILSIFAHLPTPLLLIFLHHKLEHGKPVTSFLRSWWLLVSLAVELILLISEFMDFADTSLRNATIVYTFVGLIASAVVFIFYMIHYFKYRQSVRSTGSHDDVMGAAQANMPGQSQMSFNNGVANLRFPLPTNARIVHQPRKDL